MVEENHYGKLAESHYHQSMNEMSMKIIDSSDNSRVKNCHLSDREISVDLI